ncbi:hypothetical protein P3L10_028844 [Capsicum annuum]
MCLLMVRGKSSKISKRHMKMKKNPKWTRDKSRLELPAGQNVSPSTTSQLLRIEEELESDAVYAGASFRVPVEPY